MIVGRLKNISRKSHFQKNIIISADSFALEAQNSLLKTFEEPNQDVTFFVITSNVSQLIPTLKSRLFNISKSSKSSGSSKISVDFLKKTKPERLKFIEDKIKERKDEKDLLKKEVFDLINGIEAELFRKKSAKLNQDDIFIFEELNKFRGYLFDRGASIKMILEHLALILPDLE